MNLWSFSTPTTWLAPACSADLVSEPGPQPTSQTKSPVRFPAARTILSAKYSAKGKA